MLVLNFFKSKAEAARALGVSGESVRKWDRDGVPAERVLHVCEKTGWVVRPNFYRPDIYPNVTDGMPGDGRVNATVNPGKQPKAESAPHVECCSGDPRHGERRKRELRGPSERRKDEVD